MDLGTESRLGRHGGIIKSGSTLKYGKSKCTRDSCLLAAHQISNSEIKISSRRHHTKKFERGCL